MYTYNINVQVADKNKWEAMAKAEAIEAIIEYGIDNQMNVTPDNVDGPFETDISINETISEPIINETAYVL